MSVDFLPSVPASESADVAVHIFKGGSMIIRKRYDGTAPADLEPFLKNNACIQIFRV